MNPIVIATILIAVIGLVGAILLVIASKVFAVTEDERIKSAELVLPGANCGGCGYAGCADYAKAVVGGAPTNLCIAGGAAVTEKLSAIMGVEAGASTEYKAMVACKGDADHTTKRYTYHGIPTCKACNLLYNGDLSCPYGCLGYGDCVKACKFDAITIVNGVAHVDPDKCTGCGACKAACPKRIIFLYKLRKRPLPIVMCSNHKIAKDTRRDCTAGCIGCGKCVKACPVQAMEVRGNVARVDYEKCIGCAKCVKDCPVGCISIPPKKVE